MWDMRPKPLCQTAKYIKWPIKHVEMQYIQYRHTSISGADSAWKNL